MLKKVIKCSAAWCGPCKAYAPTFHSVMENEKYSSVEFVELDVDDVGEEYEEIMEKCKVRNIPTTLLLDENNELLFKFVGVASKHDLEQEIDNNLNDDIE